MIDLQNKLKILKTRQETFEYDDDNPKELDLKQLKK